MATENRPASRTVESLGKVLYERKPEMSNQIAGIIISVVLIAGGAALVWISIRGIMNAGGHLPVYQVVRTVSCDVMGKNLNSPGT